MIFDRKYISTIFVYLYKNTIIMAEITLKFDARNPIAKKTIDYVLSLGVFKKVSGLDQALEDAEQRLDKYFKEHPEADAVRQRIIGRSKQK